MNMNTYNQDFPLLRDGKIIYFDNACQTLRPGSVIKAMNVNPKRKRVFINRLDEVLLSSLSQPLPWPVHINTKKGDLDT